ncbi:unnamed protein product [Adineta steineri]|uniref:Protein kinase domain-containing protein n=1 Tax=Adineta steineri TaxID=433720 RepID=A0A814BI99_9BILA|nr:unnamed protein product [Adineta steineri]CAF1137893.1 unnamed protein product [Adineta steineri]
MIKHIPRKVKDKYEILGIVGEGAYGVVLEAREKESNKTVAIKYFKQTPGYFSKLHIIERELNILQSLRFENVVELIEWFRDKKRYFLVFEYIESDMLQVLQEHPDGLPLEEVRHLSLQLFNAIHWCHKHDIIHRDIKPENLLISKDSILKLCDFGFARFCNTQTSADYYTNYVATRWYRSPELLIGSAYGKPVDIWACGCIMAELATGQALFIGDSDIDQLYRIQKSLGQLPIKYLEDMIKNPKFEGLKFPSLYQTDPLEPRFSHVFPSDMMNLFKNTVRLCASDRLTAEQCIQHDAFLNLNKKRSQQQQQSASQSEIKQNTDIIYNTIVLGDSHLNRLPNETNEIQGRHRSSSVNKNVNTESTPDLQFASSSFTSLQTKYRSNPPLPDRSVSFSHHHRPKILRRRTKTHSASSDEEDAPSIFSPRALNEPNNDTIETNNNQLRKTYFQNYRSTPSIHEESTTPSSPSLRYASNEILLRPKQQPLINLSQTSSKDINKRFSLEQKQHQISEPYLYRSSMIIVPEHNSNEYISQINNNQNTSLPLRQTREEPVSEIHQLRNMVREHNRNVSRSQSVNYHSPAEKTTSFQRTPLRQTYRQMISDLLDEIDTDSMVSTSNQPSRNFEQQQQQNNIYSRNPDQRKHIHGSDSHLMSSSGYSSSFSRSSFSTTKPDYKNTVIPQRRQQQEPTNSIFGVYPFARTAMKHVANVFMPSSQQRQPSSRILNTKSHHHDH